MTPQIMINQGNHARHMSAMQSSPHDLDHI